MKRIFILVVAVFSGIIFSACRQKGCMDKSSLTYDVLAEEDDGSCLYCDSLRIFVTNKDYPLIDNYGIPGTHYQQQVAKFTIDQYIDTFNFLQCGTSGCKISLSITSLVNENMDLDYYFRSSSSSHISFYSSQRVIVPGRSTINIGLLSTQNSANCLSVDSNAAVVSLNGPITYY